MKITTKSLQRYWYYFKIDKFLFFALIATFIFGIIILYSATSYSNLIIGKQLINFIIAFIIMIMVSQIPPSTIRVFAPYLLVFGIILLFIVFLFGTSRGGSTRWINLGLLLFQPSEAMKIIVPIAIAAIISKDIMPPRFMSVLLSTMIIIAVVLLIFLQPDLGTAMIIGASGLFVLFFSGFSIKIFSNNYLNLTFITTTIISFVMLTWKYAIKSYQKDRILTLFNPELDVLGKGYHIIQSKVAIGSGGLFGKGYGNGTQSQLDFLPEHSTDFIFAIIAEELGFLGVLLLLLLYLLIIYRCFIITINAKDIFSKLLGATLTMVFFIYIFINIGMVSGILPIVGVPLPFISYGGSSILTLMISFGIIMSIQKHDSQDYLR